MNPVREAQASIPADSAPSPLRSVGVVMLSLLGSMRLSVVLVLLLAALTWLGTLAQIESGLWLAQKEYFESWWIVAKLPLSFWGDPWLDGAGQQYVLKIPLPGAYPVMALLFLNLVVGGMVRMKLQARNAGVLITHVGIGLLLLAGFVKLEYSFSGHLALYEAPKDGRRSMQRVHEASVFTSFHDYELALLRSVGEGQIEERVVPEVELVGARDGAVTLRPEGLPFRVEVHHWLENCQPRAMGGRVILRPVTPQKERERNTAGCSVTVTADDGTRHEAVLFGTEERPFSDVRAPFVFEVAGQRYGLDLRRAYFDLPFVVRLDEFQKNDHPGTTMARDFRSFVTVKEGAAERRVQIFMNNPLRKDGYTLYQTNWGPQPDGGPPFYSVFEVASNPSDKWPEIACWVIFAGLAIHFLQKLFRFLGSSTRTTLMS